MTRREAEAVTDCLCGGTGKIEWHEECHVGDVLMSSSLGSALCPCRKALPERPGTATWWGLESVYAATVAVPVHADMVEIDVSSEVPYSEDNYRVERRGNRYYPTLIDVELTSTSLTLHSETARELGQKLIAAADAADAIDGPCTDVCGHWAPCECHATVAVKD